MLLPLTPADALVCWCVYTPWWIVLEALSCLRTSSATEGKQLLHLTHVQRFHLPVTVIVMCEPREFPNDLCRLPRDLVESPSLEIFQSQPDMVLTNVLYSILPSREIGPENLQWYFPTSPILWFCPSIRKNQFPFGYYYYYYCLLLENNFK